MIQSVSTEAQDAARGHRRTGGAIAAPQVGDRLPPHSPECEQGVLGCVLLSPNECVHECIEKFPRCGEVFYDLRHQTIWNVLREMADQNHAIDIITLQQRLRDRNILEQVGGIAYLASLPDAVPSAANLSYYLDFVIEKFWLRQALRFCAEFTCRVYDYKGDVKHLLEQFEADVSSLTEGQTDQAEEHIKPVIVRAMAEIEEHYVRGSTQLRGLPTGPNGNYLDKIIRGIRDKFYMVVAARPGEGKSSLAMNWVEFLAADYVPPGSQDKGIAIGVFSIEMDSDSLVHRLLLARAGVDSATFTQGFAKEDAFTRLHLAVDQLAKANIYIDATPAQTIGQIAAKARRMVKQYGIKLFVLDYLQLVEQEGGNGFDRVRELTKISRKIMALKKQLQVPWLVLAQMNRNIETAESKRAPVLSDLKDCGAIEQDADLVMFIYKPDRRELEAKGPSGTDSDKDLIARVVEEQKLAWSETPYRVNFFVAKNRFGPTGVAKMLFQKNLCRFEDWHLWKLKNKLEDLKQGERPAALGLPSDDELGIGKEKE